MDKEMSSFKAKGQGFNQDTQNLRKRTKGWNYYSDRYRDRSRDHDGNWSSKDDYKEDSDFNVSLGNHDANQKF